MDSSGSADPRPPRQLLEGGGRVVQHNHPDRGGTGSTEALQRRSLQGSRWPLRREAPKKVDYTRTRMLQGASHQKIQTKREIPGMLPEFLEAVCDYAARGHSEGVPAEDLRKPETETYYLPMHGVLKEASTTTKLRVVFDASARTSSGVSLNDQLLPGPNLYPHLSSVIISFRQYRIGMTGDISKMFREERLPSVPGQGD